MQEFDIVFRSFNDVQRFVQLATEQSFEVFVENCYQRVDAKSFMVMFSLDYRQNLRVTADCGAEEFEHFRLQVMDSLGN
jgi:phosphotransferase system HPr-like phosphotransfer protein